MSIRVARAAVEEMFAHASESAPAECCGLVGGAGGEARSVYRLRNVARDPLAAYEAAPQELFDAQRMMRARGESLAAIYHSHPRAAEPAPSRTDVRLAYYPAAVHLIMALGGAEPVMRAFRLDERAGSWQQLVYNVTAA